MKLNTRSEEPPPRGVLDVDVSDSSSVSGTSSGCSSATTDKEKAEKAGHAAAAVAATTAFNTMTYGSPVKDFVANLKQKSGVRKLSNATISMLTSCDLSTTSIHQKLACTWSADDDIDCSLMGKRWKNFTYSELVAATNDSSPGKNTERVCSSPSPSFWSRISIWDKGKYNNNKKK